MRGALMVRFVTGAVAVWLCSSILSAQQAPPQPKGGPARSSPTDYTAQVSTGGVTYAAALLSADQVKHAFAFDISKSYVVFEVAVYPQASSPVEIDPDGYIARSSQA